MKRHLPFSLCLALLLGSGTAALAQNAAAPEAGAKGFAAMDANGDGKVTKDEFTAYVQKRAADRWAKLDPMGKGFLTKEDFTAQRQQLREKAQEYKGKKAAGSAPAAQ